jgi:hypothetical protein
MQIDRLAVIGCLLLFPAFAQSADFTAIPSDQATTIAQKLLQQTAKIDKPQIRVEGVADKANGVHIPKQFGVLIVPQKDLKESQELAAQFKTEKGASLAYLFLHNVLPIADGKPLAANRLRSVTIDDQGASHKVHVFLLAVRQLADDDYRLHVYGQDPTPIVDAKFAEGAGPGPEPVAVELKDVNHTTRQGKIVVTVFGRFQAGFQAGSAGE